MNANSKKANSGRIKKESTKGKRNRMNADSLNSTEWQHDGIHFLQPYPSLQFHEAFTKHMLIISSAMMMKLCE
jgi:hypothetical protein